MKTCKKIKDLIPDLLNTGNELSKIESEAVYAHLKDCAHCTETYKKMAALKALTDKRPRPQMSDEFWDNYYSRLEEKLDALEEEKTPAVTIKSQGWGRWLRDFKLQWALYPAAAAAVLVVGIAVAQFLSLPGNQNLLTSAVSSIRRLNPAVANHFDNVQPLLVDYSNYTPEEDPAGPEETVMVGKSTIQKLLLENQLLKQVVAKEENITARQLVEELEIILLELKNADGNSKETAWAVRQLIEDNDMLFKMKALQKKQGKTSNI